MKASIAIIVVLFGSLGYAKTRLCNPMFLNEKIVELRTSIFRYFHSPPSERKQSSDRELILSYKNSHTSSDPRTVNLDEKSLMSPSPQLISALSPPSHLTGYILPDILKIYAERVLLLKACLLYTSPSPRDKRQSRMPSSA